MQRGNNMDHYHHEDNQFKKDERTDHAARAGYIYIYETHAYRILTAKYRGKISHGRSIYR